MTNTNEGLDFFNPDNWERYFRAKKIVAAKAAEEGSYGLTEGQLSVSSKTMAEARRGIGELAESLWNNPDPRIRRSFKIAALTVTAGIGMTAGMAIGENLADGGERLRQGLELFIYNGTCGGGLDHVGSCGITNLSNFAARLPGAGVDWLTMPKRFAEQARSGNGVPTMETFAKSAALVVEEIKLGVVRKSAGKVALSTVGAILRTRFGGEKE